MNRTAWAATGFFFVLATSVTGALAGCSGSSDGAAAAGGDSGALATTCPGDVSNIDDPCNVDSSLTCYSSDSRLYTEPDCDEKAVHCVDGKWQALPQTESSPEVECPATLPADGDPCPSLDCSSKNTDCNFGCQYASCDAFDPHWRVHTYNSPTCQGVDAGSTEAGDDAGSDAGDGG